MGDVADDQVFDVGVAEKNGHGRQPGLFRHRFAVVVNADAGSGERFPG